MKGRWLWIIIGANLVVLIALAFAYPHLMIAPGALKKGHADLTTDCFACHTPLHGAKADKCSACHKLPDIGLKTTKGAALVNNKLAAVPFHQELNNPNCLACHSDHAGPKLTTHSRKPFSHAMLRVATRDQCESCHKPPTDVLHKQLTGNCTQCHQPQAWKPATFEHTKYFLLDKDHNATCTTCHTTNNYKQYTCYGCHKHTPAKIQAKHRKVETKNLDNCASCHRNASGEVESKGESERGSR
jgi:hypothetical protein